MQKIMFNDKYGLTDAVLKGRKRMTRREPFFDTVSKPNYGFYTEGTNKGKLALCDGARIIHTSYYRMNEIVAVAQSYKDIPADCLPHGAFSIDAFAEQKGWSNKMFVKPDFMPHQIRITGIKVNRLQDISDEDCMKEGVYKDEDGGRIIGYPFGIPFYYTFFGAKNKEGKQLHWTTPYEAFAALIDKVSGKGTWEKNPWVFVYEFELIK